MPAGQSASARTSSACPVPHLGSWVVSVCSWGSSSPLAKAQVFFLYWPGPISSQVGGAPRSGVYINLESRNKDERDPGEKGSLNTSIYNTSAPPTVGSTFSTEAPLCVPGLSFSCTFHRVCSWRDEEFREQDWMPGDCCVSVCREIRRCCRYAFGFIVSLKG